MQNPSKHIISTTTLLISILALIIISHFKLNSIANAASSYYWQDEKGKYCIFTDDNNNNIKCFTNYDSIDDKGRYCFHFDVESKDKNGQKKVEKDVIKCYTPNKDDAEAVNDTELTAGEKCTDIQGANVQYITTNELLHSQADSLCGISPVSTETKERGYQLAAAQDSPIKICAYETANNASTTYLIPFLPEDDGSYYLNAAVFGYPSYGLSAISPINDCPHTNAMYRLNNGTICGNGYDYELAVKNHAGDEEWIANWSVPSAVCDKDSVNLDGYIKEFDPQILVKSSKKFEQCVYENKNNPGETKKLIANYENGRYTLTEISNLGNAKFDKFTDMSDKDFSKLSGGCLPSVPILENGSLGSLDITPNGNIVYAENTPDSRILLTADYQYSMWNLWNAYFNSGHIDSLANANTNNAYSTSEMKGKNDVLIYCYEYNSNGSKVILGNTVGIEVGGTSYAGLNSVVNCFGHWVNYTGGDNNNNWNKNTYLPYFNSNLLALRNGAKTAWAQGVYTSDSGAAEPLIGIRRWLDAGNNNRTANDNTGNGFEIGYANHDGYGVIMLTKKSGAGGSISGSSKDLACQVLAAYQGRINAYGNGLDLQRMCDGLPAYRRNDGKDVYISDNILKFLIAVNESAKNQGIYMTINALTGGLNGGSAPGGGHSANSSHYRGAAVDLQCVGNNSAVRSILDQVGNEYGVSNTAVTGITGETCDGTSNQHWHYQVK